MKEHENYKHICNECGKELGSLSSLGTHLKTVHSDKNHFKCGMCSAKFKTGAMIDRHVQLHMRANLFKCSICCQEFKTAVSARLHRSKMHGSEGNVVKINVDALNLLEENLILKIDPEPNEAGEGHQRTRNPQPFLGIF